MAPGDSTRSPKRSGTQEVEMARLIPPDRREHRFLLGFYSEPEARALLQGKNLEPTVLDDLMNKSRSARTALASLQVPSLNPEIRPILEPELLLEIGKVMDRPDCKQAFPEGTWKIGLVEISGIIAFQPNIDTEYAEKQLVGRPELQTAVRTCFPQGKPTPLAFSVDHSQKAITISGINPSLQVVGFNCGQQTADGPFTVSFCLGIGPNIVQVSAYRGRYFLSNGYHRVYGLMKAGFTHIPCVIKTVGSIAEIGALAPGFFTESILMSPRPPLLVDFADDKLAVSVPMLATKRLVRIKPDEYFLAG